MNNEWEQDPLLSPEAYGHSEASDDASADAFEQVEEDAMASTRQALLERFSVWLDEALASESMPAGYEADVLEELIAQETESARQAPLVEEAPSPDALDHYSLWSSLVEVKQQIHALPKTHPDEERRALERLIDQMTGALKAVESLNAIVPAIREALAPQQEATDALKEAIESLRASLTPESRETLRQEGRREAWKQIIDLLIDLRDRMSSGHKQARILQQQESEVPGSRRWSGRIFTADGDKGAGTIGGALVKGYRLTLDRLEEALEANGIKEIEALYQDYDPRAMDAVDMQETTESTEGAVVEVYQTGYTWNEEVIRKARVKVARNQA